MMEHYQRKVVLLLESYKHVLVLQGPIWNRPPHCAKSAQNLKSGNAWFYQDLKNNQSQVGVGGKDRYSEISRCFAQWDFIDLNSLNINILLHKL